MKNNLLQFQKTNQSKKRKQKIPRKRIIKEEEKAEVKEADDKKDEAKNES